MIEERFFVTGAMGCLGAWIVRLLAIDGRRVVAFDSSTDDRRIRLVASDIDLSRVTFVVGDISDRASVTEAVAGHGTTHVIHCAALQLPLVRADPSTGARVNVVGTVNVFEAAREARDTVRGVAYASSAAVFGSPEFYPGGVVRDDSPPYPETNLNGVFKVANEGTARYYADELGIGSIGLRPFVVYGPGRDQGLTATPTIAMGAAAAGHSYRIDYAGPMYYNFVADAAEAFIIAARRTTEAARVFNLPGISASTAEIIAIIERFEPSAVGTISSGSEELRTPYLVDTLPVHQALGPLPLTPLEEGIRQSMAMFRDGLARGTYAVPLA
ncbi:MAG: NAD(P)-dependent oxidoreductase [Chloroflexi bacterium]|nr:NAD(P)-dependent oxidoreductase [Chloroflexota bacterium]